MTPQRHLTAQQYREQHGLTITPTRPIRQARQMNKLEARYAAHLDILKAAGDVNWWAYEAVKLRLADNTFYTPDFIVWTKDWHLDIHETKGWLREDANVKFKVAKEMFPIFGFRMLFFQGGRWQERRL